MKRLMLALILVAGSFAFTAKADAQVYVGARIGFRAPFHRAYCASRIVYSAPVAVPYYDDAVVVGGPVFERYPHYGHFYGHPIYRERRFARGRRW